MKQYAERLIEKNIIDKNEIPWLFNEKTPDKI